MSDPETLEEFNPGDLVAFRFPYSDRGSKTRICVIVAREPEHDEVVVAYGTRNLLLPKHSAENALMLVGQPDYAVAGLHGPTRFQIDRRLRVKHGDARFERCNSLGTAKIGRLKPDQTRRVAEIYTGLPRVRRRDEIHGVHPAETPKRRASFLRRRTTGKRPAAAVS
ncbi:hypothetical protein ACFORG_03965 [Lutimaribacter marinistellae]|uniref:PemK-like, MazF-like toxin of type II toxin-antitoxin system n=1 Tax=Lutimaribacter marinistellae TaxID=1820329 RepID=A0ABV7TDW8_9RHOB